MKLKLQIHQKIYEVKLVQGVPINEEFGEVLDSASVIISKVEKLFLEPYDDVILFNEEGTIKKHFLVASYNATMLNLTSGLFKYTIDLMSETKGLEKKILPSINFKQPLIEASKRSLYYVIDLYVNTYSPKRKYKINDQQWEYRNKYKLCEEGEFVNKAKNIPCPEFSLVTPTLKDLLNYLFYVVDSIPVVKNGVINALDLSKPTGEFSFTEHENYISYSKSAENFSNQLIKDYTQGVEQNTTSNIVEKIGFRNISAPSLKLDNLMVETTYPIYSIKKVYIYVWRKIQCYKQRTSDQELSRTEEVPFLVKFDITDFIVEEQYRNLLDPDYTKFPSFALRGTEEQRRKSIKEATSFQIMTIPFTRNSKNISGWGYNYKYYNFNSVLGNVGWVQTSRTLIENIINFMGFLYPFGTDIKNINDLQKKMPYDWYINEEFLGHNSVPDTSSFVDYVMENPVDNVIDGVTQISFTKKMKSVLFEIEYQPIYSSRVKIHKKNLFNEEIETLDNQSSSLVSLDVDGSNSLFKAARLANELLEINGRYTDINDTFPIGSKNKEGYVIFKKSVSFFGNLIMVNYAATKNHIIKNYYTSVYAKIRNKTFLDSSSSSIRNENRTLYVCLSKDYVYYDKLNIKFSDDNYGVLFSTFVDGNSNYPIVYRNDYYINAYMIEYNRKKYWQEVNSSIIGDSIMSFSCQMIGNITVGNYISEFWPVGIDELTDPEKIIGVGSLQSSYIVANATTGFTDDISFSLANIKEKNRLLEHEFALNPRGSLADRSEARSDLIELYNDYLLKKPLINQDYCDINFKISSEPIWKNNGEIINYNYQIDFSNSIDESVSLGKDFFLLNDLFRTKDKNFYEVYQTMIDKEVNISFMYSVIDADTRIDDPLGVKNLSRPVVVIRIPNVFYKALNEQEEDLSEKGLSLNGVKFVFGATTDGNSYLSNVQNFEIEIELIKIKKIYFSRDESEGIDVPTIVIESKLTRNGISKNADIQFKRFNYGSDSKNFMFNMIKDQDGSETYFGWFAEYDDKEIQDWVTTNLEEPNPLYLTYGGPTFSYENFIIRNGTYLVKSTKTYFDGITSNAFKTQNCFIFTNKNAYDFDKDSQKLNVYNINELNDKGFVQSDLKVDECFRYIQNEQEKKIRVYFNDNTIKNISYFYLDDEQLDYKLVFSDNVGEKFATQQEEVAYLIKKELIFQTSKTNYLITDDEIEYTQRWKAEGKNNIALLNRQGSYYTFESGKKYKFVFESANNEQDIEKFQRAISTMCITLYRVDENLEVLGNQTLFLLRQQDSNVAETVFDCDNTGNYIVELTFSINPNEIPQGGLNFEKLMLTFFDDTENLNSEETEELMTGKKVVLERKKLMYYEDIFVSLFTNLNNRVYDDDNMLVGFNKNWIENPAEASNEFVFMENENEGDN